MAAEGHEVLEMKAHEKSYATFSWIIKWGTIVSFVVAAIVVLIIAS